MPKLLKILRGRKSSTDVPIKKIASKSNSIFRRSAYPTKRLNTSKGTEPDGQNQTTIVPMITFSLSEDEEGSDVIHSPLSDIENQVQDSIEGNQNIFTDSNCMVQFEKETKEIAVDTEDNKTVTFTHLELMRNELTHMMQLAERDKEITSLRKTNEDLQLLHVDEMEAKNQEIVKLREMLTSVEAALLEAEIKFESVNKEHTKVIEILMKTQYELYELKHNCTSSWITPVWSCFDMN
jgi:hypothetical protein